MTSIPCTIPRREKRMPPLRYKCLLLVAAICGLFLGASCSSNSGQSNTSSTIREGAVAPDFTAVDLNGKSYTLSALRGQKVLLVFYMGYFCGGCRQNLTDLSKSAAELNKEAVVLAISVDPPSESVKMNQLTKGSLTLISDPNLKIIRAYDVEMTGMASPMADDWYIVIDQNGHIKKRVQDALFGEHGDRILSNLKSF